MRLNDEKEQALRRQVQEDQIRRIVREEITRALCALEFAASDLDGYDTPELDSRAYSAGGQVAQRAVTRLQQCWTEGHAFKTIWDRPLDMCRRCGAPVPEPANPFEPKPLDPGCKHAFAIEGEVTVCLLCEGVKTNGAS
jgi:hypothetical protein